MSVQNKRVKAGDVAYRVGLRVRCLYSLFLRGCAEAATTKRDAGLTPPGRSVPKEWLVLCDAAKEAPELAGEFGADELAILKIKAGKMSVFQARYCVYCADALDPLLRALGRPFKEVAPGKSAFSVTKIQPEEVLGARPAKWLATPKLIQDRELSRMAKIVEAYAWRVRVQEFQLRDAFREWDPFSPDRECEDFFAEVVRNRTRDHALQGLFKSIRDDFPIGKAPFVEDYRKNSFSAFRRSAVDNQRLRAVRWMMTPDADWGKVRVKIEPGFSVPKHLRGPSYSELLRSVFDPEVSIESFRYM